MNNKHQALPEHELLTHKSFIRNLNLFDWAFALLIAIGAFIAQTQAGLHMDIYEMVILWASAGIAVFLGWFFKPMRWFIPLGVCLAYLAVDLYGGDIKHADGFLLKYLLSSQSAIMWQCAFVFFALFAYIVGAIAAVRKNVPSNTLLGMGTVFAWFPRWRALSACWYAGMKAICCVPMPAIFRFPTFTKYSSCSWSLRR